jgi:putative phosphoesterase
MKVSVISDIHGNVEALKVVLKVFDDNNVEKILCLGDMVGGSPMSEEVVQTISSLNEHIIVVRGNRENYLIYGLPKVIHDEKIKMSKEQYDGQEWLKKQLSDSSMQFIFNLPCDRMLELNEKKIYMYHYPHDELGKYKKHIKEAVLQENQQMFENIEADIYLYGHTHTCVYNKLQDKVYINPGSIGCPRY